MNFKQLGYKTQIFSDVKNKFYIQMKKLLFWNEIIKQAVLGHAINIFVQSTGKKSIHNTFYPSVVTSGRHIILRGSRHRWPSFCDRWFLNAILAVFSWFLGNKFSKSRYFFHRFDQSFGKVCSPLNKSSKGFRSSWVREGLTIISCCWWRHSVVLVLWRYLRGWNTWLPLVKRCWVLWSPNNN